MTEPTGATTSECTEERRGGELTMGVGAIMAPALDPTLIPGTGITGASELATMYDTLMRYNPDTGEFEAHVAESAVPNDDLTAWTVTLRDGVTFGSGAPLTTEAVKFSVERMAAGSTAPGRQARLIESMDVIDDRTMVFNLTVSWGGFPHYLANEGGMIVDPAVVADKGEAFGNDPTGAGVGPYELERFIPGEEIVFNAKDDYWGGPVCIDRIRFVHVPSARGTYEAFQTGELDVMFLRGPAVVADARNAGVQSFSEIIGAGTILLFNGGHGESPVLADQRLRAAIVRAIDVDLVNDRAYGGYGQPGSGVSAPKQRVYPGLGGLEYDPNLARQLVDEAKADGFDGRVTFSCGQEPERQEMAITVEAMLEAVGFDVTLEILPTAEMNPKVSVDRTYEIGCLTGNLPDAGPARFALGYRSDSPANNTGVGSPKLDAAIDVVLRANDFDATVAAVKEFQEAWNEVVPAAIVNADEWYIGWQDDLHGLVFSREAVVMFHDAYID